MASLSEVLAQIRQRESGGNYGLTPQQNMNYPVSHASGAYQFQPGTWQDWTNRSGIGGQYAEAYQAPPGVQDAVAAYAATNGPGVNSTALWHASGAAHGTPYPDITSLDVTPDQLAGGSQVAANPLAGGPLDGGLGTGFSGGESFNPDYNPSGFFGGQDYGGGFGTANNPGQLYQSGQPPSDAASPFGPIPGTYRDRNGFPELNPGTKPEPGVTDPINSAIGAAAGAVGGAIPVQLDFGSALSAIGGYISQATSAALGSVGDWFVRGFLILLGIMLILVAAWKLAGNDLPSPAAALRAA